MVQSWNLAGLKGFLRSAVLFNNRDLLQPKIIAASVADINWQQLFDEHGIRAIVFDKDNCLTQPYSLQIHEPLKKSVSECLSVFGRENVSLLSNSMGIESEDHKSLKAKEWESLNPDIPVIRHEEKKPACGHEILQHFDQWKPREIAVIGDRLLTDVLMANEHGMLSILTTQLIDLKSDNKIAAAIRWLEHEFLLMKP